MSTIKIFFVVISTLILSFNNFDVFALSDNFTSDAKYIGQWPIGYIDDRQSRGTPDNSRHTMGMKGNFSNEIGIKTKLFTLGQTPSYHIGGIDINGDGKENLLYGFGGKLYLGDITTGLAIWETKVLDIKELLGVENILGNGVKTIVVLLGEDRYVGLINGSTGELEWTSHFATGPVQYTKSSWPALDWKKFDIDNDGINEYHFKQWYNKYHSYRFFNSGGTVIGETLMSSQGYGDYNEGSDGYQPHYWSMGKINNKLVVGTKGSNTFAFYSNDIDPTLTGIDKFKMPAFGKWGVGGNTGAGWSAELSYFYDINGDGNDEFIARINTEPNNNKLSRVFVGGLNGSGAMVQYTSLSYPLTYSDSGTLLNNGNFSNPIPLKNYSDLENSYILSYGRDPVDSNNKWLMLKYKGASDSGWTKNSGENQSLNYDITYDAFDPTYSPIGIFNNGQKDYVVLKKGSDNFFYTFNGTGTFLTGSLLKVTGGFYNVFDFLDTRREMNRTSGIFLPSIDTNGNGVKEFVVTDNNFFKFYEITDSGINLTKSFGPYNTIPGVIRWGLTDDKKDMYAITYSSTTNTINYYRTDFADGVFTFSKKTNDSFYAGGQIRDMTISKLGQGSESYNKLMISGLGMFDAQNATPAVLPNKIGNDYFAQSFDVDKDGSNEVRIGNSAFTFNAPGSYTKKYEVFGYVGDINGDGVLDKAYAYCGSTPTVPVNVFFTIKDGVTGNSIIPDIDWGNGNGWCAGGTEYAGVSTDINGDGVDEIAVGTDARATRIISYNPITNSIIQGNQFRVFAIYNLQAFDVDGDGVKEILQSADSSYVLKTTITDKTKLLPYVQVNSGVKSTWGVSGGIPSLYRNGNTTYFAYRGVDGQVSLQSLSGTTITNHFNKYYINGIAYNDSDTVLNSNQMQIAAADIFVGDFIGDNSITVLVGSGDGGVYLLGLDGSIKKYFNIGSSIKRIIIGDVSNSGILSIFISAEDGYIYQLTNSNLQAPLWVKDGLNYGFDIETQTDNKKVSTNFARNTKATGYFVQLYNKTEKSVVFDWVDVGNNVKACIVSQELTVANCIKAPKIFSLNGKSIYEWRVQSYNANVTSTTVISNGFSVLNLKIDKKVAEKSTLDFQDEITVGPNVLLTYKITVENDSLNTVGGTGYMNYDISPAQSVPNCTGISDCRPKNLVISDYMPTTFTYMPNSTIWIVKKLNNDGTETIISGGSQVSDSYFRNQSKTNLNTNPGATLTWEFPGNIAMLPGTFLELQFDAIAKK